MGLQIEEKNIDKFIVVGDRVLIKPKNQQERTKAGLYLEGYWKRRRYIAAMF